MLCQICNKELATVHATEVREGKHSEERHLCALCASQGEPRLFPILESVDKLQKERPGALIVFCTKPGGFDPFLRFLETLHLESPLPAEVVGLDPTEFNPNLNADAKQWMNRVTGVLQDWFAELATADKEKIQEGYRTNPALFKLNSPLAVFTVGASASPVSQ